MQELVVTLLLAAHLLSMNVASAGPLVGACIWGPSDDKRQLPYLVYCLSLLSLLVGSLLGGGLLLWPSDGMYAALRRFPTDTYWYALIELLFSAGCMIALIAGGKWLAWPRWTSIFIALLTAANLLYHFPPLMAVLGELAADSAWTREKVIDRDVLLRLWLRPEILALWTHFVLASFAVASIAALWLKLASTHGESSPLGSQHARRLGAAALAASVLQIPVGLWLMAAASGSERQAMMGGSLAATLCFAGSMLAVLWLLQTLAAVALGEGRRAVVRAGYLLIVVTILMTGTLRQSRSASGADRPLTASASRSTQSYR